MDETETSTFFAKVGDAVFCKALGTHWDTNDPAHQLICRILVDVRWSPRWPLELIRGSTVAELRANLERSLLEGVGERGR